MVTNLRIQILKFVLSYKSTIKFICLQVVAQSAVNHALWSEGQKFESPLLLLLRGHVKKKKKKLLNLCNFFLTTT